MALTQVRDEQLDLSDVDQKPVFKGDARIETTAPSLEWRETDQTLPSGLFRVLLTGNILQFEANTAVGGDFSTRNIGLQMLSTGVVQSQKKISAFAGISLETTTLPELNFSSIPDTFASLTNTSLFKDSDNRLHWKSQTSVNERVAVISDFMIREVPSGTLNGVNTVFTLANTPETGTEMIFLNGILQNVGGSNDYTISGDTITFNNAPLATDTLLAWYILD